MNKYLKYGLYGLTTVTIILVAVLFLVLKSYGITFDRYIFKTIDSINRIQQISKKYKQPDQCAAFSTKLLCARSFLAEIGEFKTSAEIPMVLTSVFSLCMRGTADKSEMRDCANASTIEIIHNINLNALVLADSTPTQAHQRLRKIDKELIDLFLRKLREKMVSQYKNSDTIEKKQFSTSIISEIDKKLIEMQAY